MKKYCLTELEIQGECNLKCMHCHQAFGIIPETIEENEISRFREIANNSEILVLQGGGEPLLNTRLGEIISYFHDHDFIYFATNGLLLNGERAEMVLDNSPPIKKLSISIDAGTAETYKKIRGGKLEKVIDNISSFLDLRNKRGNIFPKIEINMAVMKENINELHQFIDIVSKLDKKAAIWPLASDSKFGGPDWVITANDYTFIYDDQIVNDLEFDSALADITEYAVSKGVELITDGRITNDKMPISKCEVAGKRFMIRGNGDIFHCCLQTTPFMNWRQSTLSPEDHPRHHAVISAIKNNTIPLECGDSHCIYVKGESSKEKNTGSPANLLQRYDYRKIGENRSK